jgi:hypothetical protein
MFRLKLYPLPKSARTKILLAPLLLLLLLVWLTILFLIIELTQFIAECFTRLLELTQMS